jgi:ATP-dependent helicase/nuclease subunit A
MEPSLPGPASQLTNHVVQAGAGAGKTRSLVEKVVSVFRHYKETQDRVPRLILTTFTRKATQELRERLIVRACEEGNSDLLEYVGNARSLHISTIHGVLNLFLSQIGHVCDLEAGFRLIQNTEERQIARVALKKTLLQLPENLLWMEEYSFQQLLTVLIRFSKAYSQDPMIAPAGLEDLEASLEESIDGTRASYDLIADEILNSQSSDAKWIAYASEIKAFVKTWEGSYAAWETRPAKPRKNAKSTMPADYQEELGERIKKLHEGMQEIEESRVLWPHFVEKWAQFLDLGRYFHSAFWSAKLNEGLLSLSDLEIFSVSVLRDKPFLGSVFSSGWDFWLIDEYQDTSPIQAELLNLLKGPSPEFVVGDPQQSIYLFRGAKSEIFHDKIRGAEAAGSTIEHLRTNYRSKPEFLNFLNDFFHSYSEQFQPMKTRTEVVKSEDVVAHFISGPTEAEENQGILAHIFQRLERGSRFEDICVLGRTHAHLFKIAAVLKEKGVPVQVHSPTGFWRRREILDAMALLKFLVHPHDNLALLTLLRSPSFRIPDETLAEFTLKRPKSLWSSLHPVESPVINELRKMIGRRNETGLIATFEEAVRSSGLLDLIIHSDPTGRREANLWKLISRIKDEEKKPGFQLLSLVEEVEGLLGDEETKTEGDAITAQEPNCVNLMTIHSSKGLEFEHVILPRLGTAPNLSTYDSFSHHEDLSLYTFPVYFPEEGQQITSPLDRRRIREMRTRELNEQDRWLYVAMTRAKQSIALCWSDEQYEKNSWAQRSRLQTAERFGRSERYKIAIERPPFAQDLKLSTEIPPSEVRELFREPTEKTAETVTVSQIAKAGPENISIKQMMARQRKAVFGVEMHRAFQTLKVRPEIDWAKKAHPGLKKPLDFVWTLREPPMETLIREGSSEWGFKLKTNSGVIQGRIDLWGKDQAGRAWIVDYKSGKAREDDSHWEQLKLYAWALQKFEKVSEVHLALVHPIEEKIFLGKADAKDFARIEEKFGG